MDTLTSADEVMAAPRKVCDGRCQANCKKRVPRCMVVAACGGLVAVLRKDGAGVLPWAQGHALYSSLQDFSVFIEQQAFDQLLIAGAPNDLAWVRASLPMDAQSKVVAEIQYPLLAEWLQEPTLRQLAAALTPLIQ